MSLYLNPGDVNFDHVARVGSARFPTGLPVVINKYSVERCFGTC